MAKYDSAEACYNIRQVLRGAEESLNGSGDGIDFGRYGKYVLAGHGPVTRSSCGKHCSLKACLRTELHNRVTLDGVNYRGKVFVRRVRYHCFKPSCPECYKAWAAREAERAEGRLREAEKRFRLKCEHIIASVPLRYYHLDCEALRPLAIKALYARGVFGGMLIFHAFRYADHAEALVKDVPFGWYWNPHFHTLGFLVGGYKCRYCREAVCSDCSGLKWRTRQEYKKDGFIVKVAADKQGVESERVTVGGTIYYQLEHCSYDSSKKHSRVVSWFGSVSYRKLKFTPEKKKELCPLCNHELIDVKYFGANWLAVQGSAKRDTWEDYEEEGRLVFIPYERGGGGCHGWQA